MLNQILAQFKPVTIVTFALMYVIFRQVENRDLLGFARLTGSISGS